MAGYLATAIRLGSFKVDLSAHLLGRCARGAGLLNLLRSEDELAAVLAHECAHVVARHGAERMSQAEYMQVSRG